MTVRRKTLFVIGVTLISLIALVYATSYVILLEGYAQLEEQFMRRNVQRAVNSLNESASLLKTTVRDWAAWDDTYIFASGGNPDFRESNLDDDTFSNLRLNVFIIADSSRQVLVEKGYDLIEEKETSIPQSLHEVLLRDAGRYSDWENSTGVKGIVVLREGALLLALHPNLQSNSAGPPKGLLFMGRWLDEQEIKRIGRLINMTLLLHSPGEGDLPSSAQAALFRDSDEESMPVLPRGDNLVSGYSMISDLFGKPGLVLQVDMNRSVYRQGLATLRYLFSALILVALVFAVIIYVLMEKLVLSRVANLCRDVDSLGRGGDISARLEVRGSDELSGLSRTINEMLITLEKSQQEKQQSEERYRTLVETSPDAIVLADLETRILVANQSTARMLGYEETADLIGKTGLDLVAPEDRALAEDNVRELRTKGFVIRREYQFVRKEGSFIPVEVSASLLRNAAGEPVGYIFVARDMTERKAIESRLLQVRKLEAIGQLAAGVAHDFNNILTGILGNIALVMLDLPAQGEPHRKLGQAEKAGRRAADLVKQLMAFGRQSPVAMKSVDVSQVVDEVIGIAKTTFDKRITIESRRKELLDTIRGDATQLHNVILNLCVNARDALDQVERRDPPPDLRIVIEMENVVLGPNDPRLDSDAAPGRYVLLSVSDTGVGMDGETRKHIFEPFFTTKAFGKGTGLGLATVYGIVKQHGGWVNVSSKPGEGSRFDVYYPTEHQDKAETPGQTEPQLPAGTETILVVDDEKVVRDFCKSLLERQGYKVILAKDGQEGMSLFKDNREDVSLVILDLSMPVLSGREVLEQIRQIDQEVKVIISSGYSQESEMDQVRKLGVDGIVGKPYRIATLLNSVYAVLHPEKSGAVK